MLQVMCEDTSRTGSRTHADTHMHMRTGFPTPKRHSTHLTDVAPAAHIATSMSTDHLFRRFT